MWWKVIKNLIKIIGSDERTDWKVKFDEIKIAHDFNSLFTIIGKKIPNAPVPFKYFVNKSDFVMETKTLVINELKDAFHSSNNNKSQGYDGGIRSWSWTCKLLEVERVNSPCFLAKCPNNTKSNFIFPGIREERASLILKYLDSPIVIVFPEHIYVFWFWLSFLLSSRSPKNSYFSKTLFLSAKIPPLVHFLAKFNYTGVSKGPKLPQKRDQMTLT